MNNTHPLKLTVLPDGNHLITTAQGNHFATTYDPQAAAQIMALHGMGAVCKRAADFLFDLHEEMQEVSHDTALYNEAFIVGHHTDLLIAAQMAGVAVQETKSCK